MISGLRDTAGRNLALLWVTMLINIIGSNMLLVTFRRGCSVRLTCHA